MPFPEKTDILEQMTAEYQTAGEWYMENEMKVIDLIVIDEEYAQAAEAERAERERQAAKRRKRIVAAAVTAAAVLLISVGAVGIGHVSKVVEHNKNCEAKYLTALELLEQGEREEAIALLREIRGYQDSGEVLSQIVCSDLYERGMESMAQEDYESARCSFQSAGDYQDAREKAEECRVLAILESAYKEGTKLYKNNQWGAAYLKLQTIREAGYKDANEIMDSIESDATEYARAYAERNEMGKAVAFLRVVEEIDPAQGEALREELIGENVFVPDNSFYIFDTTHITRFTENTPTEEFASVMIYMLLFGKLEFALMSNKPVDADLLTERAFHGSELAQELLPGYGSIYNPSVLVGANYVNYYLNYEQTYSEHQRTVHLKTFKTFCEESVRKLTEMGLLTESMNRRQKTEVIINWVGYFLTYDKSLTIHDVGVAIEEKRGVCEAFAALYNRMCNLAGIPTYGQVGSVPSGGTMGRHIWSFHLDEDGKIFYADATWADLWDIDFGAEGKEEPTVERFAEEYLALCMKKAIAEQSGYGTAHLQNSTLEAYRCSNKLWSTHKADRDAEDIIAYHAKITGGAA